MRKSLLVCGCPRSGTMYISQVLAHLGLQVGHMIMGEDGIVNFSLVGLGEYDDFQFASTEGIPEEGINEVVFDLIFHQVRHPVNAICSMMTMNDMKGFWEFVKNHIKLDLDDSTEEFLRLAEFWIKWNQKAEKMADWTYTVEDLSNSNGYLYREFCERLEVGSKPISCDKIPTTNSHRHLNNYPKIYWNNIYEKDPKMCEEMLEMMLK